MDPVSLISAFPVRAIGNAISNAIGKMAVEDATKASADKVSYTQKLEAAQGEDVFKYILLINVSALEGYVAQTRLQAEQSFRLSKAVAIIGFILLAIGIIFGIVINIMGKRTPDSAYLASITGLLIEFISGIFFYLYNRTLQQMNRFHDRLIAMQQLSMSFLATSLVSDQKQRDQAKIDLSKAIMQMPHPTHAPDLVPSDIAKPRIHRKKGETTVVED